jgi:hypothetical protein
LVDAYQQLGHHNRYEVYQQFTYINLISQPSSSTPSLLGVSRSTSHDADLPELPGATLSEELHTPPLPVTHVFLGYCWSYSRFYYPVVLPTGPNNDTPSFRSYQLCESVAVEAQELHTTPHPVGGDEAADWAGPDGSQANTMRWDRSNRTGVTLHNLWGAASKGHALNYIKLPQ